MDERESGSRVLIVIVVICISVVAVAIILLIAFTTDRTDSLPLNLSVRILAPFVTAAFAGLIGAISQRESQKDEEKIHRTEYDNLIQEEELEKSEKTIKLVLEPKVFLGNREKQTCEICNKPIKEGHIVIECPRCSALFHYNHILEWLKKNPLCPVCEEDL
ncbi:MAG: hypothetical protein HZR80_09490 [Candidatus Heimdallarchaeota archaeon]